MRIYRSLIMSGHVMGWALVWAIGGPGPWPRPLVRLLEIGDLYWSVMFFTKSLVVCIEWSAWAGHPLAA